MTNRFYIFKFSPKTLKGRNLDNRNEDYSTCRSDFNLTHRFGRVNTYGQSRFNGNHCQRGACVNSQFDKYRLRLISQPGLAQYNSLRSIKFKFYHRVKCYLKSSYISFGKFIFGIFHKDRGSSFERVKFLIDFIPVGTVSNEFAGNRGGGGFINFVQGNKKPFAMEPLFDCFDFFSFHIIHLICKYILRAGESQEGKFAIQ